MKLKHTYPAISDFVATAPSHYLRPMAAERDAVLAKAAAEALREEIIKAQHGAEFVSTDLQAALRGSSALEALAILPLIRQARELRDGIAALESALRAAE